MESALARIRSIADYQFGKGVGAKLFPENVEVVLRKFSQNKKTKRLFTPGVPSFVLYE